MNQIKRYGLGTMYEGNVGCPAIVEQADGEYVAFKDYDAVLEAIGAGGVSLMGGQSEMPVDADPLKLLECSIKNPLTPFGKLVRTLRIIAGTTLMEMSEFTGYTPSYLSGVEFGRKELSPGLIESTRAFFVEKGIPVTLELLQAAANSQSFDASRRIEGES